MNELFSASFLLVVPFGALMVFLPRFRITEVTIRSPWIAGGAALGYAMLVVPRIESLFPILLDPQLAKVAAVLGSDDGATIAWLHFLAFDVFVARWVFLDAANLGLTAWIVSPVLLIVLMFGPLGLLTYLVVRLVHIRVFSAR